MIAPNDCNNFLGIVYIYHMKKHKFLLGFIVFAVVATIAGFGYGPASRQIQDLDHLQYTEGEFDYYQTKRKWKNRKKGDRPFRKYLMIYLEDDHARYKDGKYLLDNLEQNALLMIYADWPRDTIEIGYIETDDAGLRIMYDIRYKGNTLVDLEGIRSAMKREALMLLIFSIAAGVVAILSLLKYLVDLRKKG